MSIEAVAWVLSLDKEHHQLNPSDVLVLIGLANHADHVGRESFPAIDTLADYAGVTGRTVQNAIARLRDAKLIDEGDPTLRDALIRRADRRPNVYDLQFERGVMVSPRGRLRGETGDTTGRNERRNGVKLVSPEPSMEPSVEPTPSASTSVDAPDDDEKQKTEAAFEAIWDRYPPTNGLMRDKAGARRQWAKLSWDDRRAAYRGAVNKAAHFEATGEEPPYLVRFLKRRDFDDYQQAPRAGPTDRRGNPHLSDPSAKWGPQCAHCEQPADPKRHDPYYCPGAA